LLVGIVVFLATVMLIVHAIGVLFGLALGLLLVDPVGTSGFSETVNFCAHETGERFLCELVFHRLACYYFSYGRGG